MSRLLLLAPLLLAACIADPAEIESPEVEVVTDQGTVTCQLYTLRVTLYDRAVLRPQSMSDATANDICRAEGKRRQAEVLNR
ncbi:hypothetical protein ILP92_07750 [Maribius pontilimi]|uniref:Lipoprotein n=1 Tax=Palleronia pontilimi TaxID=1964209 RepID=A0A934IBK5_9RHOB|nr:hypothetical protein [Palleronia pontilimi]MBJ3762636.1 hypothetical protein [Palleronia pontilimi]